MSISCIINTCSLGPKANAVTGSRSPTPHAMRAYALRHFIIPAYVSAFDEVIVVGEWEAGEDYRYIEVPSVHFSCVDALAQRQAGFEASKGDVLLFQHDDHCLGLGRAPLKELPDADVFSPSRYVRVRGTWRRINGGESSAHVNGHCAIYRRDVLERCPWGEVPKVHTWDEAHTAQVLAAGFRVVWTDDIHVRDVEVGAEPWR